MIGNTLLSACSGIMILAAFLGIVVVAVKLYKESKWFGFVYVFFALWLLLVVVGVILQRQGI